MGKKEEKEEEEEEKSPSEDYLDLMFKIKELGKKPLQNNAVSKLLQ